MQPKRLPQNVIETDPVPFAAREAAEKYPVTLYTFDCDVCKQAEALLVKRGVPFTSVIVSEEAGAAKLKALQEQLRGTGGRIDSLKRQQERARQQKASFKAQSAQLIEQDIGDRRKPQTQLIARQTMG